MAAETGTVAKANLTSKGTFTAAPSLQVVHEYQGVTCP
jgi:hypothetical protein